MHRHDELESPEEPGRNMVRRSAALGRPRIEISAARVRAIAQTLASYEEIAAAFGCSADTIRRRYRDQVEQGRARGTLSLKRRMWKRSKTSDRVLIHLYDRHVGPQSDSDARHSVLATETRVLVVREVDENLDA